MVQQIQGLVEYIYYALFMIYARHFRPRYLPVEEASVEGKETLTVVPLDAVIQGNHMFRFVV